ncbi:MAG: polysaccharide deacetylase family protein [Solirubrobacteraceae bacterium]|nr:polysaccharide deacetylase family protein [Solirubrobacteraceae bacterium]
MSRIDVAVCLDRLSPALPEALEAVGRAVPAPIVAAAGLSAAQLVALRQLAAREAPDARIVEAPAGIAQARNAALAASDADVLAYLDDDCAPPDGWAAALAAAWAAAPDDRAILGGPIALRFDGPRPRWLADGLLGALAPLDYGPEPLALDPQERTLRGGNVSFRTAALRAIGGFWPARRSERDWFAEEHHAQRELAAAGWSAEYRPELRVERIVRVGELRRRDVVARRARYGGRSQLVGTPRDGRDALRAAAASAAGAGLALVQGDLATASERAARAAENAGALAAPLVAHRGLQPAAPSTPFRPSVPEPQPALPRLPRLRRDEGPRATALLYHRVADVDHDPLGLAVSPATFAAQIEALRDRVVPLEQLATGDFPDGAVAITFDDGYADNLPALRGIDVPVTVFISTGHVEEGRTFWWDELARLLHTAQATGPLTVELDGDVRTWPARDAAQREVARRNLHAWLQVQAVERIEAALAQIRDWARAPEAEDPRPLTLDELRELAGHVTIGAHGRDHLSLRWLPPERQLAEMERSRDDLAAWLGRAPTAFSYPFGVPGRDVDATTQAMAARAGFRLAVVNAAGAIAPGADRFALARAVAEDRPDAGTTPGFLRK